MSKFSSPSRFKPDIPLGGLGGDDSKSTSISNPQSSTKPSSSGLFLPKQSIKSATYTKKTSNKTVNHIAPQDGTDSPVVTIDLFAPAIEVPSKVTNTEENINPSIRTPKKTMLTPTQPSKSTKASVKSSESNSSTGKGLNFLKGKDGTKLGSHKKRDSERSIKVSNLFADDRDDEKTLFEEDHKYFTSEAKGFTEVRNSHLEHDTKANVPFDSGSEIGYKDSERAEEISVVAKSHYNNRRDPPPQPADDNSAFALEMEKESDDGHSHEDKRREMDGDNHFDEGREDSEIREFLANSPDIEVSTKPIYSPGIESPKIPRYAHELSHQKSYANHSFDHRRCSASSSPLKEKNSKNYISTKSFYYDALKEFEQTPTNIEKDHQIPLLVSKAEKADQITYSAVQDRLGACYSQALYHIFTKYMMSNGHMKDKMILGKLLSFMNDFKIFNEKFNRENLFLIFTSRCPSKLIDFSAFVDILFRISKIIQPNSPEQRTTKMSQNSQFQSYLDQFVLNQHSEILEKQASPQYPKAQVFGRELGIENEALRILEGHDDLLKHIFTLYKTIDIQYSQSAIIHFKNFKTFCQDFCIVPVFSSFNDVHNLFRKFQLGTQQVIDFKGFILILCSIANFGFDKSGLKDKYNSYSKKLLKFCEMLCETNKNISNQLLTNDVYRFKEDRSYKLS